MPKKKSLYDSKSAESCPCGCCKWHSSSAVKAVLAIMFVLIVAAFASSLIFTSNVYFGRAILSFMGVIFIIVFVGWVFGFFCSCKGIHWSRHGMGMFDESKMVLKKRYAQGEITKKQYDSMMRDLE